MLPEEDESGLRPERVRTSSPPCWSSFRGLELEPVLSISQPNANKSETHYKFALSIIVIFERNYSLNFINLINLSSCHIPVFLILDSVRDDYQDPCTYSSLTEWERGKTTMTNFQLLAHLQTLFTSCLLLSVPLAKGLSPFSFPTWLHTIAGQSE